MSLTEKDVCYRHGKYRYKCDLCKTETPKLERQCFFRDPRKIPPRETNVCEDCGRTYHNCMSFIKHQINCTSRFIRLMSKIVVDADGGPMAVNGSALIQEEFT